MALLETAATRAWLAAPADDDEVIAGIIAAAQEAMERYCGRALESVTRTEYLHGTGKRLLWLSEPAESIISIHIDAGHEWPDSTLVDPADYMVNGCEVEYLDHIWPLGRRNVKVVYRAGFTSVPSDITHAARVQVAAMYSAWKLAKQGLDVVSDQRVESWSQSYLMRYGLQREVCDILSHYRAERP